MHNLTRLSTGPYQEEEVNMEQWEHDHVAGREAMMRLLTVIDTMKHSDFLLALESEKQEIGMDMNKLLVRLKRLHRWQNRLERWLKVISYHKRQTIYDVVNLHGYGGNAYTAKWLGLSRQRIHMLCKEAEEERLRQYTAKDIR